MSTPLKPPLAWQSLQVSRGNPAIWVCVFSPNAEPPKAVTWAIDALESWQAEQVDAFGEMTFHLLGSVSSTTGETPAAEVVGFITTVPNVLKSSL